MRRGLALLRRGLIALGMALGTVNTYVLLTAIYLVMLPWPRLWWLVRRQDPLARRVPPEGSTFADPDGPAAPATSDMEHLF